MTKILIGKIQKCANCRHEVCEYDKKGQYVHTKYEPKEYRRYRSHCCTVRHCLCDKPEPKIELWNKGE